MSSLCTLYQTEGAEYLARLHAMTGVSRKYLYHMATGRRRPSPEMARVLMQADSRLTLDGLLFADTNGCCLPPLSTASA